MENKISLIITSINPPNNVLKQYAQICKNKGVDFILIGDKKSPKDFYLEGCDFWSIERQLQISSKFVDLLPYASYSRKNIGYLLAIQKGSNVIIETDDDNYPYEDFFNFNAAAENCVEYSNDCWLNVYSLFTDTSIWPRGFPLEFIMSNNNAVKKITDDFYSPIKQGLADKNPDVDAVFRLTRSLPVDFNKSIRLVLGKNTWCPFNSQSTIWYKEAFALLYLPSYCSFRMTDIWRSFIAQRIAWTNDWRLMFFSPTVWQDRNEHRLLKDFEDEVSGYLSNEIIRKELSALNLKSGSKNIFDNLLVCYQKMIDLGLIKKEEIDLIHEWISAIEPHIYSK